jgi:hypothetical protein
MTLASLLLATMLLFSTFDSNKAFSHQKVPGLKIKATLNNYAWSLGVNNQRTVTDYEFRVLDLLLVVESKKIAENCFAQLTQ